MRLYFHRACLLSFILIVALCVIPKVSIAKTIKLTNDRPEVLIGTFLEYYYENYKPVVIEQIRSTAFDSQFIQHNEPIFNGGMNDGGYWFRFTLVSEGPHESDNPWLLELSDALVDNITLYLIKNNEIIRVKKGGQDYPFAQREVNTRTFAFKLDELSHEPTRVYMHIYSKGATRAPLKMWQKNAFDDHTRRNYIVLGLILGALFIMTLYNFFIFLNVKDESYIYYVLYMLSLTLFYGTLTGLNFQFLWPNAPNLSKDILALTSYAVMLFAGLFTRSFLKTKTTTPKIDKVMLLIITAPIIGLFVNALGNHTINIRFQNIILLPSVAFIIFSGCYRLFAQRFKPALYFLLAWGLLTSGVMISSLEVMALIESNIFTLHALPIGAVLEATCLSFALASRISSLQRERKLLIENSKRVLEETNTKLAANNQLKDDFLRNISHELRTPMNGVIGTLDLLEHSELSGKQRTLAKTIENSSHHMMHLVDDILTFTELQSGKLIIRQQKFDLKQLLTTLDNRFRCEMENKNLNFTLTLEKTVPQWVIGDEKHIKTVLSHLLTNAIKYTEKGYVTLAVQTTPTTPFKTDAKSDDTISLHFSIADSGMGIDKQKQSDIFSVFQQLDCSSHRSHGGIGIGLALCQQLAKQMNGAITLDSPTQGGSVFTLCIPVLLCKPANDQTNNDSTTQINGTTQIDLKSSSVSHSNAPTSSPYPRQNVLVVEDNKTNQMVLMGVLKKLGQHVYTADNGAIALTLLETTPIDLIFMDCQMPVMDGIEATKQIRASGASYAKIPIIAVTANAMSHHEAQCVSQGMSDYLSKPININIINNMLVKWSESTQLERANQQNHK